MELNWTTFILEIINFLLLVWILKRFLYKPVLDLIARRRKAVDSQTDEARRLHEDATVLKKQYEDRLLHWEKERQQARNDLMAEVEAERARQLQALQSELVREREKARRATEQLRLEAQRETEHRALVQGAGFASRLLGMAAGADLENRLIALLVDEFRQLDRARRETLRAGLNAGETTAKVASAFPLSVENKKRLEEMLIAASGRPLTVSHEVMPELLAGLFITVGPWVLRANVRDDLKGFADFAYAAR